ncbi:histidine phosphatase family protein [Vibrio sp. VB16]|uniref:histidine phosphatase family protein n=1 Tax=Vibrio sp. VB16 TaxID=2785746 RepID=UPI00189E3E27|nr:histidine phosphatase family protein [Vibrio sp. VB16]UGA53592.1 histidine phosphatase family protein [Vibrio sp. VB16]
MQLVNKPFIFMRHGETQANQNNVFCGATDIPLNGIGKQQAIDAQKRIAALKMDGVTVVSSSMLRAVETTELALPNIAFTTDTDLSERNWGDLELQPITKQVCYLETPPGGEPWELFITRVTKALNRILSAYESPMIVAHSGVYRAIQFHLIGTPSGPRVPNATPIRFWPESYGWKQKIIDEHTNKERNKG